MSHWVKAKVQVNDKELLLKALTALGIEYNTQGGTVNTANRSEEVDILFDRHFGMKQLQDGSWEVVGDPYYCNQRVLNNYYNKTEQFSKDVGLKYTIEKAKHDLTQANFTMSSNEWGEVGEDGLIHMEAVSWR